MTIPRPHSPYFLVRVLKDEEKKSRGSYGSIIIPETFAFMAFNTQCGEIVDIGEAAAKFFPEAKVGHILLMHHFVQAGNERDARVDHLIHSDEDFNYYVVSAYAYGGKGDECYGVWDGEKIIPNQMYVFLEPDTPKVTDLPADDAINQALKKTESGLFLFNEWKESREEKEVRQAELKKQAQELAKSGTHKSHIQEAIAKKESEMEAISQDINKKQYLPYTVAAANAQLSEWFNRSVNPGDQLVMLNQACQTKLNFGGKEYIVSKTRFIAGLWEQAA